MSLIDLPGPQFLVAYLVIGLATLAAIEVVSQIVLRPGSTAVPMDDPYAIAVLRGGREEAVRVATVNLVDRGLMTVKGEELEARADAESAVRRPLERAILRRCSSATPAMDLLQDRRVDEAVRPLERALEDNGLVRASAPTWRAVMAGAAVLLLGALALAKIAVALERGRRNVGFLILLAMLFGVAAIIQAGRRRVPPAIADLQLLFTGLKNRSTSLQPGGATAEIALLAAVFGLGALPDAFGWAQTLYQRPRGADWGSSDGGSASCGSSCGGGCGGGCGGCGGD